MATAMAKARYTSGIYDTQGYLSKIGNLPGLDITCPPRRLNHAGADDARIKERKSEGK